MCDARVISQKGATVVSRCAGCNCLFVWNHNLVLNFTGDQFTQFRNFIADLEPDDHTFPFPDGSHRLVMRTPVNDIQLTFTLDEWGDLNAAMEEASQMRAILDLFENSGM